MVAELTGQNVVDYHESDYGRRGILNLMKKLNILRGRVELPGVQYEFRWPQEEMIAQTPVEGLVVPRVPKGAVVRRGQTVLEVISLKDMRPVWHYKAPARGLVFNIGSAPWGTHTYDQSVVYPGQRIAVVKRIHKVHCSRDETA